MLVKNHFSDCPYGCNENGMLLDSDTGNMVPCPHCSKRKKELIKQGYAEAVEDDTIKPLSQILGINSVYLSEQFVYGTVIPDGEKVFLEEESIDFQKEIAEELYLGLSVGNLPESSLCFGLGVKGRIERFSYPMLAKAYLGGLTIGRFISCTEFARMQYKMLDEVDEFYDCDFLMMLINDGSNLNEISSAKGLMQSRALKGKPTVFVTTWTIEACSGLLGFKDDSDYFLAKPVFLSYVSGKGKKHSRYINNLLGVENKVLGDEEDNPNAVSLLDL